MTCGCDVQTYRCETAFLLRAAHLLLLGTTRSFAVTQACGAILHAYERHLADAGISWAAYGPGDVPLWPHGMYTLAEKGKSDA